MGCSSELFSSINQRLERKKNQMESTLQPPVRKFKTFTYHTTVEWKSNRQGLLNSDGKQEIEVSSPPEFKGIPGVWTPEDLFVAAVEICQMSTFLSFGGRKGIPLKSYKSSAEGVLENVEGKYRFTRITVTPEIVVGNGWTKEQVEDVVRTAHDNCLIGNSTTAEIIVTPTIIFN
jgi:organic hydroperoxide reductase OsmC/OhrA